MARGWESKSVESQQESKAERGPALTRAELQNQQKRASIEMSRRRIQRELEVTRSEARRASLEQALAFLDQELRGLS
jgi:molecular chaperone GrpE (heat shock protein)